LVPDQEVVVLVEVGPGSRQDQREEVPEIPAFLAVMRGFAYEEARLALVPGRV